MKHLARLVFSMLCLCVWTCLDANVLLNVKIQGLHDPERTNVGKRLGLLVQHARSLTPAKIQEIYEEGPRQIQKAVEPYGYFDAHIVGSLSHTGDRWWVVYKVSLGSRIHYQEVEVKARGPGKNSSKILQALQSFPLQVQDPFETPALQKAKDQLLAQAFEAGYIQAKFSEDILEIHVFSQSAILKLTLETGPRYFFGPISFTTTPFCEAFLRRFLSFQTGQAFSFSALSRSQAAFVQSAYFESVSLLPKITQASRNHEVPVAVHLAMKKRQAYQLGAGYGSVEGLHVLAQAHLRYVNAWGHSVFGNADWSIVQKNFALQYRIPASHPATDAYLINAGYETLLPKRGESHRYQVGVGYQWQRNAWRYQANLNEQIEKFKMDGQGSEISHMLLPSVNFQWMNVENPIQVENGSHFTFNITGTEKSLGLSNVSFIEGYADFKGVHTLGEGNRFLLHAQAGYILVQDIKYLPLSLRFYTGGQNSLRGYPDESIGPGRYLTVLSGEYQRQIKGSIYGTAFYDLGNAFNTTRDYQKNLNKTAGLGVLYRSPIGDIEVYVGRALSRPGRPWRFGIMLGPEL